jgi:hypothetical protein
MPPRLIWMVFADPSLVARGTLLGIPLVSFLPLSKFSKWNAALLGGEMK